MGRLFGYTTKTFSQRMSNLFAGRFEACVLFDFVIVLMTQRNTPVPKTFLTQLISMTSLATIPKTGKILCVTHRTNGRMNDRFNGGQSL